MGTAAVGAMVVGSLISAKGTMDAADAQADAAKASARAKRGQAVELLKRANINADRTRASGEALTEDQKGQFAAGGVSVGSGSTLAVMNDTMNQVEQSVRDNLQEANFKASMLRAGADVDVSLAGDIKTASKFQAAGTLIGTAGSASRFA